MRVTKTQKLLCELIALPSVNNALLPANHPRAGESLVVDFLTATAASAGLDVALQDVFPGRANLLCAAFALRPGASTHSARARYLGYGSMWPTESQLTPHVKSGRLYGRGSCDTKGSVAAAIAGGALRTSRAWNKSSRRHGNHFRGFGG